MTLQSQGTNMGWETSYCFNSGQSYKLSKIIIYDSTVHPFDISVSQ